jgi:soluble lytic murein transglycosylase-like protein
MVAVLGAQTVAVAGRHEAAAAPAPARVATAPKAPAPAATAGTTAQKTASKGTSETDELAATYREKGFSVSDELAKTITGEAEAHGISPELAFGLVATESEFNRTARSPVGAVGLAQLMPSTARLIEPGTTVEDLKDPKTNLRLGFRYLAELIDRYDGDTALALTAYNRGTGTVDRVLKRGGDPDNGYAEKVLGAGKSSSE